MPLPIFSNMQGINNSSSSGGGSDDGPSFADQGVNFPQRRANVDQHIEFFKTRINALAHEVDRQNETVRGVREAYEELPDLAETRTCSEVSNQDVQCPVHSSTAHTDMYDCSVRARRRELQIKVEKAREMAGRIHEGLDWCNKRCYKINEAIIQLAGDESQWPAERHRQWIISGMNRHHEVQRMVATYDRLTAVDVDQEVAGEDSVQHSYVDAE